MTAAALALLILLAPQDPPRDACASCHPGIVERYSRHGMARALRPADPIELAAIVGSEWIDRRTGFGFRVGTSGGEVTVEERRAGPPGLPPHSKTRPVVGVVGAGRFDRSLVLERDGLLFFAPVEWSTTKGLVPAPHQELDAGSRLTQPLTRECLECHASPAPTPDWPFHRAAGVAFSGLDCAACHGDATRHVAEHGAPGTIVKLDALPPGRQLDVCARCHLQGDARISLTRDDDPPFHPGRDLFTLRAAFVAKQPDDSFGFVSQSDRMALSRCFVASAGAMTCTTCHDPHESAAALDAARIDASCAACHRENAAMNAPPCSRTPVPDEPAAARGCATCHMHRGPPHDLPGVEVTDHWIRRTIAAPRREPVMVRVHTAQDGDVRRFRWPLPDEPRGDPREDELTFAMAQVHLGKFERAELAWDIDRAAGPPPARLDRLPLYHFMRARALEHRGRTDEAVTAYRDALARDPRDPEARTNLGLLLALRKDPEAEPLLAELAHDFPAAAAPWRNLAGAAAARGDRRRYAACIESALDRDSDLPGLWLELARTRFATKDVAGALAAAHAAIAADPDVPRGWTSLGIAAFESGDRTTARAAFEEALRRDPNDRDALVGRQRTGAN